jgi:hypothetical protein
MRNWSAAAVAALLIAGCNSQEKGGNGAANAAGNAAANTSGAQPGPPNSVAPLPAGDPTAQSIQPGEWEMTSEMVSVEAPGAPPQVAAQLRASLPNQRQTRRQCITPAEAANIGRNLIGNEATARGCRFADTTFAGGVIRIGVNCRQPGGQATMQMAVQGSFSATQLNAGLRMNLTGPRQEGSGVQAITMTGRMSGRRIGECPAGGTTPRLAPPPAPPSIPAPRP